MAEMTCAEKLAEAKAALHAFQLGQRVVSCMHADGRRIEYSSTNIDALQRYIQQLEAECGDNANCTRRRPFRVRW